MKKGTAIHNNGRVSRRAANHPPTPRDAEVLAAIEASLRCRGRMPTMKELCADAAIHRSALYRNLNRLVENGMLIRQPRGTLAMSIPTTTPPLHKALKALTGCSTNP